MHIGQRHLGTRTDPTGQLFESERSGQRRAEVGHKDPDVFAGHRNHQVDVDQVGGGDAVGEMARKVDTSLGQQAHCEGIDIEVHLGQAGARNLWRCVVAQTGVGQQRCCHR